MTLTKREITIRLAEKHGITQQQALDYLQTILDILSEEILNGRKIELRNFGVFESKQHRPRVGRNPRHPQMPVAIPARQVVSFHPGKSLKSKLNAKTLN